ncbi:serine/threonine protein kinase [Vreelandella jeotgali]|uniref:serine/threonine protein kinase n=1 Tax=Vreelandella jeotgali TaxID=553386 RepID=UPI00036A3785|nr:serine/threonine protein kinase [Halomonas jeotgali]
MTHVFAALSPTTIVAALESVGMAPAGEPFALNSYENRVLLFRDDDRCGWVAKFYRPERWSTAVIQEEHDYLLELAAAGVGVAAPLRLAGGQTLHHFGGFDFALFSQQPGQAPELEEPAHLFALGEVLGHLHGVADRRAFVHRPTLELASGAARASDEVLASGWLNADQRRAYERVAGHLVEKLEGYATPPADMIRCHGDCHLGNILGRDEVFTLVDFDDCLMAPAMQDIWMLLSINDPASWQARLSEIREGYEEHREFPGDELSLIEPLRSYRLMRYSAWLVARWQDPAFPAAFPWLAESGYVDSHIRELEQQRMWLDSSRWLG